MEEIKKAANSTVERPAPPSVSPVVGDLRLHEFSSHIYRNTRMLRVWLPPDYEAPENAARHYPVFYLNDGQNLFDPATAFAGVEWEVDETADRLIREEKIPPLIIVGIDNATVERIKEFFPYRSFSPPVLRPQGKHYPDFLMNEIMPFVWERYRISRGAMNTGVGGSSYGGDIALYTALQYPGLFGHVLVESPELWIGKNQLLKDAENAKLLPRKIYLGIGTKEGGEPTRSTQMVNQVRDLESILVKKDLGASRLRVAIEEGGQGNEAAWSRRLPDALLFLYGQ